MPTPQLKLAIMALATLTATACHHTSGASSSEIKEAVKPIELIRVEVKAELCRGQMPERITREQYDAAPQWAKDYVVNNGNQWAAACGS